MNHKQKLFTLILLFATSQVLAQEYSFTQSGFSEGAIVTVTFSGSDLNADTQITSFDGEVTAFSMSFSGNSVVPAFSLGLADLFGLVYDDDGGPLGDGLTLGVEGIGASGVTFSYDAGPGPFDQCGIGVDCAVVSDGVNNDFSQELLVRGGGAIPVPTLSQWAVLVLILLMFALSLRHNQNLLKRR
jgi:hypothetical protein